MIDIDSLKAIKTIVTHAHCPDGVSSALILHDVLPEAEVIFAQYGTPELAALPTMTPAEKRIENRVAWKGCTYRGPILLHAAKSVGTIDDFDETCETIARNISSGAFVDYGVMRLKTEVAQEDARGTWRPHPKLPRGGIVGRARIVGVVRNEESFADYLKLGGDDRQRAWWFGGFALVLADVEPLPFVPWKGALGLFEVPDNYATIAAEAAAS